MLNVIENRSERDETLVRAYTYAEKFMIASVMLAGQSVYEKFTPYKDGVITRINTFQKYYSQTEFSAYLEETLDTNAVAVAQGVFIVFKDKQEEQRFLLERQSVKRNWTKLSENRSFSKPNSTVLYDKHRVLFDDFWETTLNLGRMLANSEFEFSEQLRRVAGSHKKALDMLIQIHGVDLLKEAEAMRRNDLIVYFALGLFKKRKAYVHMPESLKRDIKTFFGQYTNALDMATQKLYGIGDTQLIEETSMESYKTFQTGQLNSGHSWIFHQSLLPALPAALRIYVGCAAQLFGDLDEFDLLKIHFTSAKVTLLRYDDWANETPLLVERVKINLRTQDIDFFYYGDSYEPQPLEEKFLYGDS